MIFSQPTAESAWSSLELPALNENPKANENRNEILAPRGEDIHKAINPNSAWDYSPSVEVLGLTRVTIKECSRWVDFLLPFRL